MRPFSLFVAGMITCCAANLSWAQYVPYQAYYPNYSYQQYGPPAQYYPQQSQYYPQQYSQQYYPQQYNRPMPYQNPNYYQGTYYGSQAPSPPYSAGNSPSPGYQQPQYPAPLPNANVAGAGQPMLTNVEPRQIRSQPPALRAPFRVTGSGSSTNGQGEKSNSKAKETNSKGVQTTPIDPDILETVPRSLAEPRESLPPSSERPAVCGPPGRVWGRAEYLLWWTKGTPLPPLLTTSPPGTPLEDAGVLGRPGTTVLFGDETVNGGARSGGRFTLGGWFNPGQTTGIEGNFFFLADQTTHFHAESGGIPILARPFFDVVNNRNDSLKIAYPGFVRGSFDATVPSSFYGASAYLRQNLLCSCNCRLDLLGGYRFMHLGEGLGISETEIGADPTSPLFGIPLVINEGFNTANNFNGGVIGLGGEYRYRRWFVQFQGLVGLGATSQNVDIHGNLQVNGFAPVNGGFLALPSNIGNYNATGFSAVPEVWVNVGYQVTQHLRLMAGYTFLYWSNVVRPGNVIDLGVNTSQPPLGDGLIGPARPAFNFNTSDFWAQGVSFGLELRF